MSRVGRSLVPMVAAAALLSGCSGGITDAATPVGAAVRVGDDVISQTTVNNAAEGLCASVEEEFEETGQVVSMVRVKQVVVGLLTDGLQAQQIAEEYGVTPGPEVAAARIEVEKELVDLPDDVREAYLDAAIIEQLLPSVLRQAGEVSLEREGVARPTEEQIMARGSEIYTGWAGDHPVDVDPRYSMVLGEGGFQFLDTSTSVAVSEVAVDPLLQMLDPEAADPEGPAALPESQRCG